MVARFTLCSMIMLLLCPSLSHATPVSPTQIRWVHASLRGNLEATLRRAGLGRDAAALAAQAGRLLSWRGDITRQLHPKDALTVGFDTSTAPPELVALSYRGRDIRISAFAYAAPDSPTHFYDPEGQRIQPALQRPPVKDYIQITDRVQPKQRGQRRHDGIDLKAPEGTPVYSPFAGTVSRVNWRTRVNGLCVEIRYAHDGTLARFLHLSAVDDTIRPGQTIAADTRLGDVGSTGRSSAPHLHYELRDTKGRVLDPLQYHGTTTNSLDASTQIAFNQWHHALREARDRAIVDPHRLEAQKTKKATAEERPAIRAAQK